MSISNSRDHLAHTVTAGKRVCAPIIGNIKFVKFQTQVILRYISEPAKEDWFEAADAMQISAQQLGEKRVDDRNVEDVANFQHRAAIGKLLDCGLDRIFDFDLVQHA